MEKYLNRAFSEIAGINVLARPDFKNAGKVHDWRNYVPDEMKNNWNKLTDRERMIIIIICDEIASQEDWD